VMLLCVLLVLVLVLVCVFFVIYSCFLHLVKRLGDCRTAATNRMQARSFYCFVVCPWTRPYGHIRGSNCRLALIHILDTICLPCCHSKDDVSSCVW
jgi:hypothetical protein